MIRFVQTQPMPCAYLENQQEERIVTFLKPKDVINASRLISAGYRRSMDMLYRPACKMCNACIPMRIDCATFNWTKSWKKLHTKLKNYNIEITDNLATEEDFKLFAIYQGLRHPDSEMAHMQYADYQRMIEQSPAESFLLKLTENQNLLGVILADLTTDGISAVYSFYDSRIYNSSLGSMLILALIEQCKKRNMNYLYLGYWVKQSPKMSYKQRFKPFEILTESGWVKANHQIC